MGKLEQLQELLGQYCAGGYASGFYGEANAIWAQEHYPHIVVVSDVYRIGPMALLTRDVTEDTEGIDELIETLENLDDYPLVDDSYLQELISNDEQRAVKELAIEWNVSEENVWKALEECDAQLDWEQDYVYLSHYYEEQVKAKALELGQTWSAHYYGEMSHTPEVCGYCAEAKEVA